MEHSTSALGSSAILKKRLKLIGGRLTLPQLRKLQEQIRKGEIGRKNLQAIMPIRGKE